MPGVKLIQAARKNIRCLLEQCGVPYEVTPFDENLYQESVDDAVRRGYPVDGGPSLRTYLRQGVVYAATAGGHLSHRPTQIWIALYVACSIFIDDVTDRFPEEMPNIYLFNNRFVCNKPQENLILSAFADIIRRTPEIYPPVASHLITTATLNFVTANILEHETTSMMMSNIALQYPIYQRKLSGVAEAYSFMVFPLEVPLNDYIQAIPEVAQFINNVNDVLSFYKEELAGERTNLISMLAARNMKSKLRTLREVSKATACLYKSILEILEGSEGACEAFKLYAGGFVRFHTSLARYRLQDLHL